MRLILIVTFSLFISNFSIAQINHIQNNKNRHNNTQNKANSSIDIVTLIYCLNGLKVEDADSYFLKKGYEYSGTTKYGDSTLFRYKRHNSFQSVGLYYFNNKIVESFYYTTSDAESSKVMSIVKSYGFIYKSTLASTNNVSYTDFIKKDFKLTLMKKHFEDEQTSAFYICLKKLNN